MARSKQGSIIERGKGAKKRIYARIRWTERVDGVMTKREKFARVQTRSDGREKIKQMLRDLEDNGPQVFAGDKMTFSQLADHYSTQKLVEAEYHGDTKIAGLRSPETARAQLDPLNAYFGDWPIKTIDYEAIAEYKRFRLKTRTKRKSERKLASVHRELERLRAVIKYAIRKRWLTESPFDFGDPLITKSDELRRDRLPTDEEEQLLLEGCTGKRAHLRPILICLSDTGIRPGEAFRLTWEDVDFKGQVIRLKPRNTKTLRERWVGMTTRMEAELKQLWELSLKQPGDLVFGIRDNVKKGFKSLCEEKGIRNLQLRDFRNKTSTDYQLAGIPDALAMKGTGHTQRRTYEGYVKVDQQIARDLARQLEQHRKARAKESNGEHEGNYEQKEA